tara:strand:- start:5975 stop:6355 length:381 start_codon:yes stop_codon:yes gene_type:complete
MAKKNNNNNLIIGLFIFFIIVLLFIIFNRTNSDTKTNNNYVIEYYSMNGCTHCEHFEKEWKQIEKFLPYNTKKYSENMKDYNNRIEKFNIEGFPHIQLTKNNMIVVEFRGIRVLDEILKWYKNNSS